MTSNTNASEEDAPEGAYVRFAGVQKSYDGETLVVKNLNLDIERGEFLTMLGPSGSGKTTCLMMLAGFETATHGEIFLAGQPINNVAPHKRDIGMVFQNYALFPHMTVAENLAFPLKVRKRPSSEVKERVDKALGMVELTGFGNRRPAQLSGGSSGGSGAGTGSCRRGGGCCCWYHNRRLELTGCGGQCGGWCRWGAGGNGR